MTHTLLVNVDVDDLAKAEAFYGEALGLEAGRRLGDDVVELVGASSPVYLLRKPAGSAAASGAGRRDYARHWTPVHLDFVVDDIHAAVARVQAAGARLEGDVRTHPWGHIAHMADPFGHGLCLIQFLGRDYDEIVTAATGPD